MNAKCTYQINGHYHFQMKVPRGLASEIGQGVIRKSLNTDSLPEALATSRFISSQLKTLFMQVKFGIIQRENIKKVICQVLLNIESIKSCVSRLNTSVAIVGDVKVSMESEQEQETILLSSLIQMYSKEHINAKRWTQRTQSEFKPIFDLFIEIAGDIDVKKLNQKVIMDYRDKLSKVPANRKKLKECRGKPLAEMLEMKFVKLLHLKTVNRSVSLISSLLKWSTRLGYIQKNYAEGLSYGIKSRPADERKPYSTEDLRRLLKELVKIDKSRYPERYWVPIIGMYSGMRQGEICSLYARDVRQMDGIWCFDINQHEDNKSLKTASSRRIVPIHNDILKLGFLDFVRESTDGHLWQNLKYYQCRGYAHSFKKWYLPFNRKYITQDKKKVFHSLRHTVINNLKQANVIEQKIAEVVGHTTGSIDMERYGKSYNPQVLLETLNKLDYGFDIVQELSVKSAQALP